MTWQMNKEFVEQMKESLEIYKEMNVCLERGGTFFAGIAIATSFYIDYYFGLRSLIGWMIWNTIFYFIQYRKHKKVLKCLNEEREKWEDFYIRHKHYENLYREKHDD